MRSTKTYIAFLAAAATLLAVGCKQHGGELSDDDRAVRIVSDVSYQKISKGLAVQTTPLEAVRFLQLDGTTAPTDFTAATPFSGNRAADGSIAWQGTTPVYDRDDKNAYFVAYHPVGTETANTQTEWRIDGTTDILRAPVWNAGNYSAPKTGTGEGETPLVFEHVLAQLHVVFKVKDGMSAPLTNKLYGKVTGVKYFQTLPTATYDYATQQVAFSGTPIDLAFRQSDCHTAFAPIEIPGSTNETANAGALVAPSTGSFVLLISTEKYPLLPVTVQLSAEGVNKELEAGKKHTVVISFRLNEVGVEVSGCSIAEWTDAYNATTGADTYPESVEAGGVRWATGNLVADGKGGCKIGRPTDGGLYFQFGSLIGYKGGNQAYGGTGEGLPQAPLTTNGTFWNGSSWGSFETDAMVWPSEMTSTPSAWPTNGDQNTVVDQWFFSYNTAPYSNNGQDIRDFSGSFTGDKGSGNLGTGRYAKWGIGDPCTYYLGGTWRLPTTTELASVAGKTGTSWIAWTTEGVTGRWATASQTFGGVSGPGAWLGTGLSAGSGTPSPSTNPFFPASGYRYYSTGSFYNVTGGGHYWSSSVYSATHGYLLYVHESNGVLPQGVDPRSYGFPVRCVQELPRQVNPPAPSQYVTIDGLRWTKGNLIAKNNHECMVGAPTDGGLYFQFGSLIGYKGGNQANGGNGVGMPQAPLTTNGSYWNGSTYSWASDAMVWPSELVGTKTTWTSTIGDNIATLSDYYFNYSMAPWETSGQNIRDFAVSISGDKGSGALATGRYVKQGVGDPCTYYLGDPWRLPTTTELASITGKTGSTWISWVTPGVTGCWGTAGQTFGGASGPGAWFGPGLYSGSGFPNPTTHLFFPTSGWRLFSDGSFSNVGINGYHWSSSIRDAWSCFDLYVREYNGVVPQDGSRRSYGFPVRCVSGELDYVAVDGVKWAKGNLVASNATAGAQGAGGCKIGKPEDGGLYFQFGSLIGYKGGNQANGGTGVGMPQAPLTTNGTYWNGSGFTWASDAMVWPAELVGTKTSWTNTTSSSISTLSDYYFNYSVAPWETAEKNIRDFNVSISGDKGSGSLGTGRYAKQGVGDPCTYYLGGTWRLPTTNEIVVMCNNQSGYGQNIAWGSCGASWTTSPVAGGNFYSNKLFFPASGFRNTSNGSFYNVTTNGRYWSSSVYNATYGLNLDFHSSWVYPQNSSTRSNGFPVRCVRD